MCKVIVSYHSCSVILRQPAHFESLDHAPTCTNDSQHHTKKFRMRERNK